MNSSVKLFPLYRYVLFETFKANQRNGFNKISYFRSLSCLRKVDKNS